MSPGGQHTCPGLDIDRMQIVIEQHFLYLNAQFVAHAGSDGDFSLAQASGERISTQTQR